MLGPNILSKGVGTGPTATHFGSVCAQAILLFMPDFDHMSMASRDVTRKLW